jgi:hypothetical protein
MNYIIESIFVGIYSAILYLFFSRFITPSYKNLYFLLIIVGFSKHLVGSFLNIHTMYCNNGEACVKTLNQDTTYIASKTNLFRDSVLEAIAYLFLGFILQSIVKNMYLFFIIGFLLHLLAEIFLIHTYFCKTYCESIFI